MEDDELAGRVHIVAIGPQPTVTDRYDGDGEDDDDDNDDEDDDDNSEDDDSHGDAASNDDN